MPVIEFNRRRIFLLIASLGGVFLFYNVFSLNRRNLDDTVSKDLIPDRPGKAPTASYPPPYQDIPTPDFAEYEDPEYAKDAAPSTPAPHVLDSHPISALMKEADRQWRLYEGSRSTSFRQALEKYRSKNGRHPPPGFKEWYQFAREKNVWNIDDFDQIMDDLRPFWAVDPKQIRTFAGWMWQDFGHGIASLHIRDKKIVAEHNPSWRSDTMKDCINKFVKYLPDMDIPINRLDQPRVVVPWDDLQALLKKEYDSRAMSPEAFDSFTREQSNLTDLTLKDGEKDESVKFDAEWFYAPGKQYMDIASKACPPESPAKMEEMQVVDVQALYKEPLGGLVKNFNLSSDLCTVGPGIKMEHGLLYAASSIIATHKLVPVFGECKVNVNNDILFPANMYYKHDDRYDYSDVDDLPWKEKSDNMIWRGVTSGGVQNNENWHTMHRQRLVQLLNGTFMEHEGKGQKVDVLTADVPEGLPAANATFEKFPSFQPSSFANMHTDVGFVESWGCDPDCSFYNDVFSWKEQTTLSKQFRSKYLIDVDGHSFSGRWHAFLQSKSLGFKATIFREWHDSRLFAWRHFIPVDNRYDDLYSLLTYFIGYGKPAEQQGLTLDEAVPNKDLYMPAHDLEAQKMARQGREWANKVLRRDDIEVYMFRLLLEYGRIIDDNRDRIGYSGDGSELDRFDEGAEVDSWSHSLGFDKIKDKFWGGWGKKPDLKQYTGDGETDGRGDRIGFERPNGPVDGGAE